ncbi:chemotaxis protein CheW [Halovulum dunhuangense]|uniref:Chemotaxis protein CheW n=1 Tax=Halovulum dunhuangense TaxID=1505036 RepID=A0A849L1F5_9RHOB|nr:chemotaxis protein CheW [Halovulum dunhuangense]NNU80077.1 chemotaxis protein CheW [Halovulum dunhuangense]
MAQISQYVTLSIAGEVLALPVDRVREILSPQPIARLPGAPSRFLGMIEVRDRGVPVLDLRLTLGLAPAEMDENTRIVVVNATIGDGDAPVGLMVDRVFEVTALDGDALEPPPEAAVGWRAEMIVGLGRRNGRFVTVLDFDRLFGTGELGLFAA